MAAYLAIWLSEAIFSIAGKEIQSSYSYLACKMAFGTRFALAPALVSYLCMRLKMIRFLVNYAKPYNRYFGEHLFYAWFVYHCRGLHHLGEKQGLPFYRAVTNRSDMGLSLDSVQSILNIYRSYDFCKRLVVVRDLHCTGLVDKENSHT